MDLKYFPLGNEDNRLFVRIARLTFGAACIIMAAWWFVISIRSELPGASVYVTIAFLLAIGTYLVLAGLGKADRFIVIVSNSITIKKNPFLPVQHINAPDIKLIEIHPLKINFMLVSGRNKILRFGTVNYETNEKIVDSIISFSEENNIEYKIISEEI